MPGIFGIVDPRRRFNRADLMNRMQKTMTPGKDFVANAIDEGAVGMGYVGAASDHRFDQPVAVAENRNWGVVAGQPEINATIIDDLPRPHCRNESTSEGELLLLGFEAFGRQVMERVEGSFVVAHWQCAQKHLSILNDQIGIHALYYVQYTDVFCFASEVEALLHLPFVSRKLNQRAVDSFSALGCMQDEDTFYVDIKRLPPDSLLEFRHGILTVKTHGRAAQIDSRPARRKYIDVVESAFLSALADASQPLKRQWGLC